MRTITAVQKLDLRLSYFGGQPLREAERRDNGVLMRRCPLVCDVEAHSKSTNARFAATSEDWGAQAIDLQLEPVQQVFRLANNEVSPAKRMRLSDAEA